MLQKSLSIEELCNKLKPLFGNKIDQLYLKYSISESLEEKNEILQILSLLYQKHLNKLLDKNILLEPPKQSFIDGEYNLADISYSGKKLFPFKLREDDWSRHVCISGMSGSGKTTFAFNILSDFVKKQKPFLVFDWKKSFRPLMNVDPSLMCFTVGNDKISNDFKININRPPQGVSPREWINVLCDLLTESFAVSFGVHKVLLETLDEIFEKWGVYNGEKHYPNWQHVKRMLELKAKESKGRESAWYESAMRVASILTFGDFGNVINYDGKKSLSVEELFDKRVILELNSLSNTEKKFFCEFLLTYIYKFKKSGQERITKGFNYAILVDEAHNIFLKNKTNFLSESVTDMIYREMREYGVSLICLDQHISKLSDTVKGNSACHIAFQQQLPQDIFEISSLMQLADKKEYFSQLPVGSAIVKLSERFNSPFLIEVPFIELRNQIISDEKIASKMKFVTQTIEIEKEDPEFKEEIIYKENSENLNNYEIKFENSPNKKVKLEIEIEKEPDLTRKQEVLYNFILDKLNKGKELKEIEKLLENGLSEKLYSFSDILTSVNYALRKKLEFNTEIKIKEQINETTSNLTTEENKMISFLRLNPSHEYSTVELYKKLGLSTRKGNIVKESLINKKLIVTQEEKYNQGWKKYLRLAHIQ